MTTEDNETFWAILGLGVFVLTVVPIAVIGVVLLVRLFV